MPTFSPRYDEPPCVNCGQRADNHTSHKCAECQEWVTLCDFYATSDDDCSQHESEQVYVAFTREMAR